MFTRASKSLGVVGACIIGGAVGSALIGGTAIATMSSMKAAPTAVGSIDITKVMQGLKEAEDARSRLNDVVKGFQTELDEIRAELKKIDAELEPMKDRSSLEYLRRVAKRVELEASGRARTEGLQRLVDIEEGRTLREMFMKVQDAAKRLAEQQGYDVILLDDRGNNPPEGIAVSDKQTRPITQREVNDIVLSRRVLAVSATVDLTQALVDFMNNEYAAKK